MGQALVRTHSTELPWNRHQCSVATSGLTRDLGNWRQSNTVDVSLEVMQRPCPEKFCPRLKLMCSQSLGVRVSEQLALH